MKQKVAKIIKPECGGCCKEIAPPTNRKDWCNRCWPWQEAQK